MTETATITLRMRLGCWFYERWRLELLLRSPRLAHLLGWSWLDVCNRRERLLEDPVSGGRICDWVDTSRLTIHRVFPDVVTRLLHQVMQTWHIDFNTPSVHGTTAKPEVSFVIPFGGRARLSQLHLCLKAVRAQIGVPIEVIVVEQSEETSLKRALPDDVLYVHQPLARSGNFNKSKALNAGAFLARSENLLLIDADFLLPQRFAAECCRVLAKVDALRPARLIFYLDHLSTELLTQNMEISTFLTMDALVANAPMPIAIRKSVYWEIGGHDEDYIGWGGEDTEFLDRLRTRKICEGGWMPILHAWHAPASMKADIDPNRELHAGKMNDATVVRIGRLVALAKSESRLCGGSAP